jgi:hypothetical protein
VTRVILGQVIDLYHGAIVAHAAERKG